MSSRFVVSWSNLPQRCATFCSSSSTPACLSGDPAGFIIGVLLGVAGDAASNFRIGEAKRSRAGATTVTSGPIIDTSPWMSLTVSSSRESPAPFNQHGGRPVVLDAAALDHVRRRDIQPARDDVDAFVGVALDLRVPKHQMRPKLRSDPPAVVVRNDRVTHRRFRLEVREEDPRLGVSDELAARDGGGAPGLDVEAVEALQESSESSQVTEAPVNPNNPHRPERFILHFRSVTEAGPSTITPEPISEAMLQSVRDRMPPATSTHRGPAAPR
eukprot:CAMPEP_0180223798 /NCGR_PEP_ID=MMETSP0987-20121128/21639_1 /TAXON_ID=697907 /ORGANISM="non described non described, Strain CCMP2293" /LENGTH=270 /DNA_ID=CAMNT_0022186383 /DNA_START=94 /DNA_END=904 /DNA_ORIENTATION=+